MAVDLSPFCCADLRALVARRVPAAEMEVLEMAGADYHPELETFDVASCLGASWAFGGHRGTLQYLAQAVRPGGVVVTGEPFWKKEPGAEYLASSGMARDTYGTHAGNVEVGEARDPECAFRLNSRVILRCVPPWIQDRKAYVPPVAEAEAERRRQAFYDSLMEQHVWPALVAEERWVRRWEPTPSGTV